MFLCKACKSLFVCPMCLEEFHDDVSGKRFGDLYVCPACGDTDYVAVKLCKVCGIFSDNLQLGRCPDCVDNIVEEFESLINTHFFRDEIEILNSIYDGKEFGV